MLERDVYNYLVVNHFGSENLIKNETLRALFGIKSDKSMRKVIQNIRKNDEFNLVVGSISGRSGGFYICKNIEEVQESTNNIRHRTIEMNETADIMIEKALRNEFYEAKK